MIWSIKCIDSLLSSQTCIGQPGFFHLFKLCLLIRHAQGLSQLLCPRLTVCPYSFLVIFFLVHIRRKFAELLAISGDERRDGSRCSSLFTFNGLANFQCETKNRYVFFFFLLSQRYDKQYIHLYAMSKVCHICVAFETPSLLHYISTHTDRAPVISECIFTVHSHNTTNMYVALSCSSHVHIICITHLRIILFDTIYYCSFICCFYCSMQRGPTQHHIDSVTHSLIRWN